MFPPNLTAAGTHSGNFSNNPIQAVQEPIIIEPEQETQVEKMLQWFRENPRTSLSVAKSAEKVGVSQTTAYKAWNLYLIERRHRAGNNISEGQKRANNSRRKNKA